MNSKFWYLDGTTSENNMDVTKQLHRVDGPAAVWDDGYEEWRQYDKLHRTNGPALIKPDGGWQWYIDGKCTCYSGPAKATRIGDHLSYDYCIEDEWMSKAQFQIHPKNIDFQLTKLIEETFSENKVQ